MASEKVPMLADGYRLLEEELKRLKVERPEIVDAIEEARAHGDLSENAEYHAAKERQGQVEAYIADIEDASPRELIGVFTKLATYADLTKKPITLEVAEEAARRRGRGG